MRILLFIGLYALSSMAIAGEETSNDAETSFVAFEAHRVDERAEIHWISESHEMYIVERSLDRDEWIEVLKVKGAESTSQTVEYFDIDDSAPSSRIYYRIKRFSEDGAISYSNIVLVPATSELMFMQESKTIKTLTTSLKTGTEIQLPFDNIDHRNMLLVMRSSAGNEYFAKVEYLGDGSKYLVVEASAEMTEGSYIITATSKNSIYSSRMVIGH